MIQPISSNNFSNNINFSGTMQIKTKNYDGELKALYGMFPEDEGDIFEAQINEFKEFVEENTGEDADFTLVLDQDDWYAGGSALKRGKAVTFNVLKDNGGSERQIFGGEIPIVRQNGELWYSGKAFTSQMQKFLKYAKEELLGRYFLHEALENIHKARKPRPIHPVDGQ